MLTRTSIEPQRCSVSSTSRWTSSSVATSTVTPTPPANDCAASRRPQVGDHDPRALRREPVGDRAADPLRRARDDGDLAVERAHQRIGRERRREAGSGSAGCGSAAGSWRGTPASARRPAAARAAPRAPRSVVAPEARVRRERADSVVKTPSQGRRGSSSWIAGYPRARRGFTSSRQLARDHVVVALLDDHRRVPSAIDSARTVASGTETRAGFVERWRSRTSTTRRSAIRR